MNTSLQLATEAGIATKRFYQVRNKHLFYQESIYFPPSLIAVTWGSEEAAEAQAAEQEEEELIALEEISHREFEL